MSALAVQADRKILVGGAFTTLRGQIRNRIGRLNPDGTLDNGFNPGANGSVYALAVQTDGKIVVGGQFTMLGGQPRTNIARLNADGTLDGTFNPSVTGNSQAHVACLAIQADGGILVGGSFTALGGQPRMMIGRLNADGTVDSTFNPGAGNYVYSLAVQPDGKIIVGGWFTSLGGQPRNSLGRLDPDGTLDSTFTSGVGGATFPEVTALAVQADGKILVGGWFGTLGGFSREGIGRLNADGTLDEIFNPGTKNRVRSFALQADGRIVTAFAYYPPDGTATRHYIGRVNADGTLDSFYVGANDTLYALALQPDGKILVGGLFTNLRNRIARLNNTGPATEGVSHDGSTITWLRGGTSPEVWHTSFAVSTNGADWTELGAGGRLPAPPGGVSPGWELPNAMLSPGARLRARGWTTSGQFNGSSWFAESYGGFPFFATQPVSRTNSAGTVATFSAVAGVTPPLSYQWLREGQPLANAGNISGAQASTLTVSNVFGADAARYAVVVSNAYGSVTSAVARLTVLDPIVVTSPTNLMRNVGETATFTVTPLGTPPLAYQWRKEGVVLSGATASALSLTNVQRVDAGWYDVDVSNAYGSVTSAPATLSVNLATLDSTFNPGASAAVNSVAVQADGRVLVGGAFTTLGGQPRSYLGRLNANGTLDSTFNPGAGGSVSCLAMQTDEKILVGGAFTSLAGQACNRIGRLNPDGTLDIAFNPGANATVRSLALQTDGKILVGGNFTTLGGQSRNYLGRLNSDGTLDDSFNPGASDYVRALAVQPDGKILVGGYFSTLLGQSRSRIGRLNADGSLDDSFNPGASSTVYSIAVQADGQLLVGGYFSTLGGQPRMMIGRLNADGTLDSGFNPGADLDVYSLAVQADGKILAGGYFSTLGGQPRSRIGRLNADGTLDSTFNLGASSYAYALALQPDGRILVGGDFSTLGGQSRAKIGRLNNTDPATQNLSRDGAAITWLRGGTSPEAWRTIFEATTNNSDWTLHGAGVRIAGGWQLTGVSLPSTARVRARGFVAGGGLADWFAETFHGSPAVSRQPASSSNNAFSTASLSVVANGSEPLDYRWFKDGVPLVDGGNLTGAFAPTLVISNLLKGDEGLYHVVVSNAFSSVTSAVAILTVLDPAILTPPASLTRNAGETGTFSVTAVGTPPLDFQWWKDGDALAGGTSTTLTLTNVQLSDVGDYRVVVSNRIGSLASSVATLSLNLLTVETNFNPGAGGTVSALALQTDGKILLGGLFTTLAGQTRNRLGRLNANGTLDTSFSTTASATVYSLAVQPDGKILVGGDFTFLAGQTRRYIGRLTTNGILDTSFNTTLFNPPPVGSLVARVQAILLQPDGKIILGGRISFNGGPFTGFISRVHTNGATDTSFITTSGVSGPVASLAFQTDGKILAGGLFTSLRGEARSRLGRLNADGSLDTTFDPGADNTVLTLAVQADGKILVGGAFNAIASQPRTNLARLNPDGTADASFAPTVTGGNAGVYSLAPQTDGRILLSGLFSSVAGQSRANLARLNADGTLDASFNPGANNYVYGLAIQPDGKILAGGDFTQLAGQSRSRIGRLNPTEPATDSLNYDGSTVTWQRGGSSPEVWRTSLEFSTNLNNWSILGNSSRTTGGWELGGLDLLPKGRIRARGYAAGGAFNASGWFLERTLTVDPLVPPMILTSDGNFGFRTNLFGFNLSALGGQIVVFESSTDLQNWQPLQTNTLDGAQFYFTDPESSNAPSRFYRARLLP
ncbi:MAG: immunoglobulin domain-containing protein [Verrucomicrobia bacterium]|nr:immunoglobulin domain-containing protein [Verrucomicrobiota bacterium]